MQNRDNKKTKTIDEFIYRVNNTLTSKKILSLSDSINKKPYVMLMVSGGVDSVALAYCMDEILGNNHVAIMHLNHNIRGKEADQDAKFVAGLAKYLNVEYFEFSKDVPKITSQTQNGNLEAIGRQQRYICASNAAYKWADMLNISSEQITIATAHNANDRAETFIMRSIVGTGPGGLASIEYSSSMKITNNKQTNSIKIIRPLLEQDKQSITEFVSNFDGFLDKDNRRWKEDSTNSDTTHFRSFVRNEIVPLAKKYNGSFEKNLCSTMDSIALENEYLEEIAKNIEDKYVEYSDKETVISLNLAKENKIFINRVIYNVLHTILPNTMRINSKSIQEVNKALNTHNYTVNIIGDMIVHSNKAGVHITSSHNYRQSRKRFI